MDKNQILCFVTLGIYLLTAVFFLCGFGGPNWVVAEAGPLEEHSGLWQTCLEDKCQKVDFTESGAPGWFRATVSFMILALVGMVSSGVSFLWLPVTTVCHFITGGFTLTAIIIYGAEFVKFLEDVDEDLVDVRLGWSFALATLSALLFLVNGVILAILSGSNGCSMTRRSIPCFQQ